jgi:hypothetical protein
MKKIILKLVLITLFFISCKKQKVESQDLIYNQTLNDTINSFETSNKDAELFIQEIKNLYSNTESSLASLKKKETRFEDDDNGVNDIIGFFNNDLCIKLVNTRSLGHGSIRHTFYINDDKIYFVLKEEFSEESINGPYTQKETRYYLNNDKIFKALFKEKTINKSINVDLSSVQNKEVPFDNNEIENLKLIYTKAIQSINSLKLTIDQGTWVSDDDKNTGIIINNDKWIFFANRTETENDVFDFKIINEEKDPKVVVFKNDEIYEYILIENTPTKLKLIYIPRGNTLSFTKRIN